MKKILHQRHWWLYLAKFAGIFCVLYYGTLAVIGLAAPGGLYITWVDQYLDYVGWLKYSLMQGTAGLLWLANIPTHFEPGYLVRITGGRGVYIAMSCVGFGVYSFWTAFVLANRGTIGKKLFWVITGLLLLWTINTIRITLFLTAINRGWAMPLGIDHHTWFNIFAYGLIFILMYVFGKYDSNAIHQPKKQVINQVAASL